MDNNKQSWVAPVLTVFGSVETLTLKNKQYGPTDGYTFSGVAISG